MSGRNTNQKALKGFTLIEVVIALALIGGIAAAAAPMVQKNHERRLVQAANEDVQLLQEALYAFHMENRRFPNNINELVSQGYYFGPQESPWGSDYQLQVNPEDTLAHVRFDSPSERHSSRFAKTFQQGSSEGNTVQVALGRPSREAVLNTFLHRTQKDDCPECNRMETDIDMASNNITDVGTMYAQQVEAEQITTQGVSADTVDVEDRIGLGSANMHATADGMRLDAGTVDFSNDIRVAGDLEADGGDFTGFGTINASRLNATDVIASDVTTDRLTADSATITELEGDALNYAQANFNELDASVLSAQTGTITSLTGSTLNYTNAEFSSLDTDSLTAQSGQINQLSGTNLNYASAEFATLDAAALTGQTLQYSDAYFSDLEATQLQANSGAINTLSGSSLDYTSGEITTLESANATITNLSASQADIDRVNVTQQLNAARVDVSGTLSAGDANFASVQTGTLTASTADFSSFNANSVTFNTMTVNGTLSADDVNVSNQTTTGSLSANSSSLGSASATSMNVSGTLDADRVDANSADLGQLNFNSAQGNSLNVSSLTADSGTFSTVNAVNVFSANAYSSDSDINRNYSLIQQYQSKWNSCLAAGGCKGGE